MGVTVTHSCGHVQMHDLFGQFAADLDHRAARLARSRCSDCKSQVLDDGLQAIASGPGAFELPELEGSFRQKGWASEIRARRLIELHKARTDASLLQNIVRQTDAQWWIASRALKRTAFIAHVQGALAAQMQG